MNKKKRCTNGQVTIFIILGLILLFAAVFVIQLTKEVRTGELEKEREGVIGQTFRKEALRIYVEGCLTLALEEGLELIGKQGGRIWKDQGGRTEFISGETGIDFGDKVSYAITHKDYLYDGQYPCEGGEEPDFCKYQYPNSSILIGYPVKFGGLGLSTKIIEDDLKRFLINKTIGCVVEDLIEKQRLSPALEVSTENLKAEVDILNEGIKVKVEYPLTLGLGGEEFFHLAEFSFLYPSEFKKLLEAAITSPLSLDWSFVDFDYNDGSLRVDSFVSGEQSIPMRKSEYESLGIDFQGPTDLDNGDDLFIFNVGLGVLKTKPYTFQFVRQNRPPALDYIERNYCDEEGYDYLVILEDDDMGTVNIKLSSDIGSQDTFLALDPDEDTSVSFSFSNYEHDLLSQPLFNILPVGRNFIISPRETQIGWHNLTVTAKDGDGAEDKQKVRILVDRSIKPDVSLDMPYNVLDRLGDQAVKPYKEIFYSGIYPISNEDPVFLKIKLPENSSAGEIPSSVNVTYNDQGLFDLTGGYTSSAGEEQCFNLPWDFEKEGSCNIIDYTLDEFKNWPNNFDVPPLDTSGTLGLNFAISYCGKEEQEENTEIMVNVQQCIPHRNATNPWAFPYHKYTYGLDANSNTDYSTFVGEKRGSVSPFLATHSCCDPLDWTVYTKEDNRECFVDPIISCYGGTEQTKSKPDYILEQRYVICDGERGNICGGEPQHRLYQNRMLCGGEESYFGCESPEICNERSPWSLIPNQGWCYGNKGDYGCEQFCSQADGESIIYTGTANPDQFPEKTAVLDFECGDCSDYYDNTPCDDNFDGVFDNTCQGGTCI